MIRTGWNVMILQYILSEVKSYNIVTIETNRRNLITMSKYFNKRPGELLNGYITFDNIRKINKFSIARIIL